MSFFLARFFGRGARFLADIFRMECFEQDLSYIVEGPNFKFFKQKSKENMPGLEQFGKPNNPMHTTGEQLY